MSSGRTISVAMPPDLMRSVEAAVETGEFASNDDAIQDAVRHWRQTRSDTASRLAAIRSRLRSSLDDLQPDLEDEDVERRLAEVHDADIQAHRGAKAQG